MPKNYPCPECEYVSQSNANLNRHRKTIYKKEKNIHCMECDKAFKIRHDLVAHVKRVHFKIRLHEKVTCNICGQEMAHTRSLKYHLMARHEIDDPSLKKFPCQKCEKVLASGQGLRYHTISIHSEDKGALERYHCTICKKGFTSRGAFTYHLNSKTVHSVKEKDKINEQ